MYSALVVRIGLFYYRKNTDTYCMNFISPVLSYMCTSFMGTVHVIMQLLLGYLAHNAMLLYHWLLLKCYACHKVSTSQFIPQRSGIE